MTDFTKLVNRGHKKFIAKHMKKRNFGKCMGCEKYALLLEYTDPQDDEIEWILCEECFSALQLTEK